MTPFARFARAFARSAADSGAQRLDAIERLTADAASDVAALKAGVQALGEALAALQGDAAALLAEHGRQAEDAARLAAPAGARLASDSISIVGRPSERLQVRRLRCGDAFERHFGPSVGMTRVASTDAVVRSLWARLEAREAACADDVLRGAPPTALAVHDAVVTMAGEHTLEVRLHGSRAPGPATPAGAARIPAVAVPKFTYQFSARKLRNVGHWILDCLPQVAALDRLAPDAVCLLPAPLRSFQRSTLALLGLSDARMQPWTGEPLAAERLLVLEDEGRAGGGRPLAALSAMRQWLTERLATPARPGPLRLYVSRRDAKPHRRWLSNEPAVEALFEQHGFTVVSMADCPLPEQVRLFGQAGIIAGISGAGLADIVFAPPGAHVIVLVSDGLMQWYADEGQSRSLWMHNGPEAGGELAELGDSPRFYGHVAAAFGQVAHYFVAADQMPLDALSSFIGDALAAAESAAS